MSTDVSAVLPSSGWHVESGNRYLPSNAKFTQQDGLCGGTANCPCVTNVTAKY